MSTVLHKTESFAVLSSWLKNCYFLWQTVQKL